MSRHIIQVAGVLDERDLEVLTVAGVTHIGFPLRLEVNSEEIPERRAADLIRSLPRSITPVLITYLREAARIVDLCRFLGCWTVQLHGAVTPDEVCRLKSLAGDLSIWKSLVVGKWTVDDLVQQVEEHASLVDAFITDTFRPETGASGATGRVHDWRISRKLVQISPRPLILDGGLTPANVAEAIGATGAAGVDAHTGLEGADGHKDKDLVVQFAANAHRAWAESVSDGHQHARW